MENLTELPAEGLTPDIDVSFHYRRRVIGLLLALAAVIGLLMLASTGAGDWIRDDGHLVLWAIALGLTAALIALAGWMAAERAALIREGNAIAAQEKLLAEQQKAIAGQREALANLEVVHAEPQSAITDLQAALAKLEQTHAEREAALTTLKAAHAKRQARPAGKPWGSDATVAMRWIALVAALLTASHFGHVARLAGQTVNIIQIELAASPEAALRCACSPALEHTIARDYWFIGSYVLLLGMLAFWAGAYFRLQTLRQARVTITVAAVVAGVLDIAEDVSLRIGAGRLTDHPKSHVFWRLASICAWGKFTLLLLVILYVAAGAFAWWVTPRWVRLAAWVLPDDARRTAAPRLRDVPVTSGKERAQSSQKVEAEQREMKRPDQADLSPAGGRRMSRGEPATSEAAFGIALSGGGIRASSISLGALQILEAETQDQLGWDTARTVTAVSGGSNMAAGWSIARSTYQTGPQGPGKPERVEPAALNPKPWRFATDGTLSPEERHLVDNLGYLAASNPRGSDTDPAGSDSARAGRSAGTSYRPTAFATILAGLTINTLVLFSALWLITRPAGWAIRELSEKSGTLDKGVPHALVTTHSLALPGITFLLLGFAFLLTWVFLGQSLVRNADTSAFRRNTLQTLKEAAYGSLALGAVLVLTLWGFVELVGGAAHATWATVGTAIGSAIGLSGSVIRILRKPLASRFAPMVGGVLFIVVGLCVAALTTWQAARQGVSWNGGDWRHANSGWNWVAAAALLVFVQLRYSPERWSLAPFYRGKLRMAYATYRTEKDGVQHLGTYQNDNVAHDQSEREPGMFSFIKTGQPLPYPERDVATPLVLCATTTVSSRAVRTHYGTPALSVTFDPDRVTLHLPQDKRGIWLEYAASTRVLDALGQKSHKRMTTMLAAAAASAAVSPAMGRYRIGPTSMLLTFFNIRLGVWIANPRYVGQLELAGRPRGGETIGYPRAGLGYLAKEFFGIHDLDDPYLYVTDGGHWENTGLVEMLRHADITEVVCVDADDGPGDATNSLGKAIDIAPLECGVRIDISLDPLRAAPSDSKAPSYAPRTVNVGFVVDAVGDFDSKQRVGVVWYCKPGLTRAMPAELLAFHESHQDYPRTNTVNQFFDTSTFVAYRDLGRYNARMILEARAELQAALLKVRAAGTGAGAALTAMTEADDAHWVVLELHRAATSAGDVAGFCAAVEASLN
jgi:hypothetical protein